MVRLMIEDVTLHKDDQIRLHVLLRGGQTTSFTIPIPSNAGQARQTNPETLAVLDWLLDEHTDAETAQQLNATGHRSGEGKPFTSTMVVHLRRAHDLPSHHERPRAKGLLTKDEIAQHLGVPPPQSRIGTTPGCCPPTKPTTKTCGSTNHPCPATRAWSPARAVPSATLIERCVATLRAAGVTCRLRLRGDVGYFAADIAWAAVDNGGDFSLGVMRNKAVWRADARCSVRCAR